MICNSCIHYRVGVVNRCSQGYEDTENCQFEDWRSTYKGEKEMIVAFTKLGPASDILIRETKQSEGNQYRVEVRRNLKLQHETPYMDYETAEKLYDGLLSDYGGE